VSGEDPEVWDGSLAERQLLGYQTCASQRKKGNCVREKASSTGGWRARPRPASEHLAVNSDPESEPECPPAQSRRFADEDRKSALNT